MTSPANGRQVAFKLPDGDYELLCDMLDKHEEPIALGRFVKQIFMVEFDRIRVGGIGKHRLSAKVLRAARADGRGLDEFVTHLVEVGLAAHLRDREAA